MAQSHLSSSNFCWETEGKHLVNAKYTVHMFSVKKHAGACSSQFYGGVAVLFKQ